MNTGWALEAGGDFISQTHDMGAQSWLLTSRVTLNIAFHLPIDSFFSSFPSGRFITVPPSSQAFGQLQEQLNYVALLIELCSGNTGPSN